MDFFKGTMDAALRHARLILAEDAPIKSKFLTLSVRIPGLKALSPTVERVESLRQKLHHSEYSPVDLAEVEYLLRNGEEFRTKLKDEVEARNAGLDDIRRLDDELSAIDGEIYRARAAAHHYLGNDDVVLDRIAPLMETYEALSSLRDRLSHHDPQSIPHLLTLAQSSYGHVSNVSADVQNEIYHMHEERHMEADEHEAMREEENRRRLED